MWFCREKRAIHSTICEYIRSGHGVHAMGLSPRFSLTSDGQIQDRRNLYEVMRVVMGIKCAFRRLLLDVSERRALVRVCFGNVHGDKHVGERNQSPGLTPLTARQMAIDGLIILDSTNVKPIVQTSFRYLPPAYPLLHIDAYSAALEKASRPEDVDPVLLVNLPDAPTACCHLQHRSLVFLCPISGDRELFHRHYYFTRICAHTASYMPQL